MELYDIIGELKSQLDEYEMVERELKNSLENAKADRKRIESAISILSNESKKNGGRRNTAPVLTKPPTADQILKMMQDSEKEDWVATEVTNVTGLHQSTVNKSLKWLRENNKIRATRKVRGGGHAYAPWQE